MEMILAAFISELRAIGLPVSLSENVDAAAALRAIPLADRAQVKSALATTLVKNHDHYRAFELAFDIFFGGRQLARLGDETGNGSGAASQAGSGPGTLLHQLSEDELNDLLFQAVAGRDGVLLRAVAVEAVDRWAGIEPGRVVAGTFYLYRTLTRLDLEALRQRLRDSADPDGLSDLGRRLAEEDQDARVDAVRFDGHSDYGMALETFWDRWGGQVRSRTSVIILGDGRNNYHASRAWVLTAIRQRARHLYWLNPEPAAAWDTGDSIMREYAPGCDLVFECRNLRQLRAFVEQLD
jgi:uncharacterized protein with von Willebrand factor type A (vWA) domain